jgi:hypothetical protein
MPVITLPVTDSTPIAVGTCVVQTTANEPNVRAFDAVTDGVESIIGVVYNSVYSGNRAGIQDGPVYYDNSVFTFDESLKFNIPYQFNMSYDSSIVDTNTSMFAQVMYSGFCAILKDQTVPSHWIKLRVGDVYDWFIINL